MTARETLTEALALAVERGQIKGFTTVEGRVRVIPKAGPVQAVRSLHDLDLILAAVRRREAVR